MAGPDYTSPKLYDITVPDLFTLIAHDNPNRHIVQIIREHVDIPTDSIRITWATLIRHAQDAAADLRARWAKRDESVRAAEPRKPGAPIVVVAMLGANGYEYYVNLLACTLNRWTVLPISPKNSDAAIEHLLRTSNANLFVVDSSVLEYARGLEQSIPGLYGLLFAPLGISMSDPSPGCKLTPLTRKQLEMEIDMPAFYMHTSGSTGHPKIITWTHRFFLSGCRSRQRDGPDGIGLPFYSVPPLCHAMGIFAMGMFVPAHANVITFVSSATSKPSSAASLLTHIPFIKGGIIALPPSILEELHDLGSDAVSAVAEGTSMVIFAGAPLKRSMGDALIAAGLKLCAAYGSTELGPTTKLYRQNPENWEYVEFREGYDWQFIPVDKSSELRELVASPAEDTPAVINHEWPRGYATGDIWVPHPSLPNLWKHHSRKGDITVLSNGEKTDNKQIESLLLKNDQILNVLVFGSGRLMNGVLLQPRNAFHTLPEFLSLIQPTVDEANAVLPRHSRLVPELVIIASENKPFVTTDKGTIRRQDTLDRYAKELEQGYAILEEGGEGEGWSFDGDVADEQDVKRYLRDVLREVLDKDVPDTVDLFEYGLDSLLAIRLRGAILTVVKKTVTASLPVPRNIIYTFPSINALTDYICTSPGKTQIDSASHERILKSIAKFSDFAARQPSPHRTNREGFVFALTGSTGSLGCSLLALLLQRKDILKIYLLNRKGVTLPQERQREGFRQRGLSIHALEAKIDLITFLDIDLSRNDLGLICNEYNELRDNVTHIIHAAWHLNFNLVLESYERVHIAGVRHLIELALSSPRAQPPRIIFLSSIAAATGYRGISQTVSEGDAAGQILVPETPIDDPSIALHLGYGQSKYVSERILVSATQFGLPATIVRVGQLSGVTATGAWSLTEQVPIMLRSSMALGTIPDDLPSVRWVPSDVAASAILKQTFGSRSVLEYFHVENTILTPWKDIAHAVSECSPRPMHLVSLTTWLKSVASRATDAERIPAVRLLDFYHNISHSDAIVALGWERSVRVAPELAVGPVTLDFVKKYVSFQLERSQSV